MPIENRVLRWQLFATVVDFFSRKLVPIPMPMPMPDTGITRKNERVEAELRFAGRAKKL